MFVLARAPSIYCQHCLVECCGENRFHAKCESDHTGQELDVIAFIDFTGEEYLDGRGEVNEKNYRKFVRNTMIFSINLR